MKTLNFELPVNIPQDFEIKRYPKTTNKSLKAWSSSDEFAIHFIQLNNLESKSINIYNDGFGYLSCYLKNSTSIINTKSQEKAIKFNLSENNQSIEDRGFKLITNTKGNVIDIALLKIPKSLESFEYYLHNISQTLSDNSIVICSFMTKYFTKGIIEIAEKYFGEITQTKAWKKSRLLILSAPYQLDANELMNEIESEYGVFKQYYGVFSSKNIDYASQFLIQNMTLPSETSIALDLASGNGVLAKQIQNKMPDTEVHLVDDSILAIESSKLNITGDKIKFHLNNELSQFEYNYFDYIISNPPFHIEHEIDISLPIGLFKEVKRHLKVDGSFQLVFNKHLNYKTHLEKLFKEVSVTAENEKFTVLTCKLPR